MSVAFLSPLHSHRYLITAFVVNKYEQSAKNGNKGPIKSYKQRDGRKLHFLDKQTDRETDYQTDIERRKQIKIQNRGVRPSFWNPLNPKSR